LLNDVVIIYRVPERDLRPPITFSSDRSPGKSLRRAILFYLSDLPGQQRLNIEEGRGWGRLGAEGTFFFKNFRAGRIAVSACLSSSYPPLITQDKKKRLFGLQIRIFYLQESA
jgi:hypothetical protein